jgi:hypothetical protein
MRQPTAVRLSYDWPRKVKRVAVVLIGSSCAGSQQYSSISQQPPTRHQTARAHAPSEDRKRILKMAAENIQEQQMLTFSVLLKRDESLQILATPQRANKTADQNCVNVRTQGRANKFRAFFFKLF